MNCESGARKFDGIPPKPKRPLTVYNLFSKLERNYIVQMSGKTSLATASEGATTERPVSKTQVDPYLELRPRRYRHLVLPHDWFKVGKNKTKRSSHQNHGIISFEDLSATVAEKWKTVDDETREFCERVYSDELREYQKGMTEYVELHGEEAVNAQKRTYQKKKRARSDTNDSDALFGRLATGDAQSIGSYSMDSSVHSNFARKQTMNSRSEVDALESIPRASTTLYQNDHFYQRGNAAVTDSQLPWIQNTNSFLAASLQGHPCTGFVGVHSTGHASVCNTSSSHFRQDNQISAGLQAMSHNIPHQQAQTNFHFEQPMFANSLLPYTENESFTAMDSIASWGSQTGQFNNRAEASSLRPQNHSQQHIQTQAPLQPRAWDPEPVLTGLNLPYITQQSQSRSVGHSYPTLQLTEIQEAPEQQCFEKQEYPQPPNDVTALGPLETNDPPNETKNEDSGGSETSNYSLLKNDLPCGNELKTIFDDESVS